MRKSIRCFFGGVLAVVAVAWAGCGQEQREQSRGFHLPGGDPEVGKANFVSFNCHRCHDVEGVDLPEQEGEVFAKVTLGGEIYRVRSYGDLVTSVISPDHKLADQYRESLPKGTKPEDATSPMPVFNRELTVQELIDLVAFLHSRYRLIDPASDEYYYVMP